MTYRLIYASIYIFNALFVILMSHDLNVNDILNPRFLPGTLLLESPLLADDISDNSSSYENTTTMGDLKDAFDTMQYHRSMMNEYLCHNYVADEILSHLSEKSAVRLQSRMGEEPSGFRTNPTDKPENPPFPHKPDYTKAKHNLLFDPGSKGYKEWLARSTLFDDIYRHYDQVASADGSQTNSNVNANSGYEGGQITGYAVQADKNVDGAKHGGGGGGGYSYPSHPPSSGGSSSGHSAPEFGATSYSVDYDHHHHDHHHSKSLALKDLFDLALTALAFLAFGMFVLNVIMLCMTPTPQATVMMMMTTTAEPARSRRYAPDTTLDDLAYRVLLSMDSLLQLQQEPEDENSAQLGHCFRYSLCDNNRFSRELDIKYKVWLPVWSFGMSWLEGKLRNPNSMLENIKASVLGLGNGSCDTLYASCTKMKRRM